MQETYGLGYVQVPRVRSVRRLRPRTLDPRQGLERRRPAAVMPRPRYRLGPVSSGWRRLRLPVGAALRIDTQHGHQVFHGGRQFERRAPEQLGQLGHGADQSVDGCRRDLHSEQTTAADCPVDHSDRRRLLPPELSLRQQIAQAGNLTNKIQQKVRE